MIERDDESKRSQFAPGIERTGRAPAGATCSSRHVAFAGAMGRRKRRRATDSVAMVMGPAVMMTAPSMPAIMVPVSPNLNDGTVWCRHRRDGQSRRN
jgi:hypothetical protein